MTYYKIVEDGKITGAGYTPELRRVQAKHLILITADENDAEYIQIGEELYRDNWFAAPKYLELPYKAAKITVISKEEYDSIKEAMQQDEEIFDEPEDVGSGSDSSEAPDEGTEETETLPSARERLAQLEEQVETLQQTNDMLTECLLEMSEIVYGG